jgi:hypothetical protein
MGLLMAAGQSYTLDTSAQATLSAAGLGTATLAPPAIERWHVTRIAVATNQASTVTTIPVCKIYVNSISDANLYDGTFTGNQDSTDADLWLEKGQQLIAQWTGGVAATIGTISIFGNRVSY